MRTQEMKLPGAWLLQPTRLEDARGYFVETYNAELLRRIGIDAVFVQDNQSFSVAAGTVRGLHFQLPPEPQAKLVRVVRGRIFDVAVDLRRGSPTYGQWIGEVLDAKNGQQLFIPRGFAHGFCTLEADTEVAYKVDGFYSPDCDSGILWNDPTLAIHWPIAPEQAVLSPKDRSLPEFLLFESPFEYGRQDA
jgi:dTDP-4-dehydrorhamnose 3,5-epimerase